ncbi:nuclear transport factor 2 family protein [Pseudoalteromonas maricaloris]|uniref:nuclear transport factor 2 family protein n=1 Tax=Pseudoalteromonas maricaloris TaxID=184924 RepID=UPI00029A571E|nr:nuclear transport factor 2 family protein [Pseudoalteromonas flavipulchra]
MKVRYALLTLMLVSSLCSADTLSDKVNAYFDAQEAVEHQYSTESDVTQLLTLLTPDASFEHPRFNAVLSKEEYKKGLLSYLGQYGKCDIEVTNIIEGLNAVTVEYLHPCVDQQGNTDEKENKQKLMTLFEFSGEKIKRIRHYF